MKNIIKCLTVLIAFLAFHSFVLPGKSEAQITCSEDFLGRTVCSDSYGNRSETQRDFLGRDVTTFGDGSRMTCRTDFLGRYVCD